MTGTGCIVPAALRSLSAAAVLLVGAAACGDGTGGDGSDADGGAAEPGTPPGRTAVVVSVPPLAWFADRLADDRVEISVMVPPGASPATYEPTARQMRTVGRADLYVAVGHPRFPFEAAWLDALTAANPEMAVVRAGARCRALRDDPHLWVSPRCAGRMAGEIGRAMERVVPAPPENLTDRIGALSAKVDSVAAEMARRLEPHRGRAFLVFHPALGYLARDFGLRQMSVSRGPTGPGPAGLGEIIRRARKAGIQTVFVQPQFSREAARVVARELPGGRVVAVDPLARDWASGMVTIAEKLAASFRVSAPGGDRRGRAP